jgi:hypothetical protein
MADQETDSGTYSAPAQIGLSPADVVRRWTLELSIAGRLEKEWVKTGDAIVERYRGTKQKKNSFNILWSNTETLSQSIYNTLPKPDVRRRYRDADPVAKVVSDVLERSIDYSMDVYDFDQVLRLDVTDMLLPGRGVSRVKYVPDFEDMEDDGAQADESKGKRVEPQQRLIYERAICEHVNWKDFRHGPGKTWDEVPWVAFRHKMSQIAGVEMFGSVFKQVTLDAVADEEIKKQERGVGALFKTAEVWEIWDKDDKTVTFIASSYKPAPLKVSADPLELDGFFPNPRPLFAILDAESLIPAPLFDKYKQQADELDRISSRINNLTDALKVRGVYNSVLTEIQNMKDAGDNELVAATNVQALVDSGGLEKNIWMMPIEAAAKVIQILNVQRDACKAVIYEITGIADIMRGASDSRETLGAQKIKTQWGTQRLKKMQAEFQRYVRDIIRLKSQIIANKFQIDTIKEMTGIKLFNTEAERKQVQQQAAQFQQFQQMQQAQQQQQPQGAPQ